MRIFSIIFVFIVIIFGVTFSILNAESVSIHYYFGAKQLPLSFIMAISFSLGLFLGVLLMGYVALKEKASKYRLKKHLKMVEQEIENLRKIPLHEGTDLKL